MASSQNSVLIEDDDPFEIAPNLLRRSSSNVSSASSHTMRAESSEDEVIPAMERPSVQPPVRTYLKSESITHGRKRRSSEFNDQHGRRQRARFSPNVGTERVIIDLDEEEDAGAGLPDEDGAEVIDIEQLEREVEEQMNAEAAYYQSPRGTKSPVTLRNAPILPPFVEIDAYKWKDFILKTGETVELAGGHFLKIKVVVQDLQTNVVTLRGWELKRTHEMKPMLRPKLNEVVFVFEVTKDDHRDCLEQSVMEVLLNNVVRLRKLICTNRPFPECRYENENLRGETDKEKRTYAKNHEVLIARWKYTLRFDTERVRLDAAVKFRPHQFKGKLEQLSEEESTSGYGTPAASLRFLWRGNTALGGSGVKKSEPQPEGQAIRVGTSKVQRYVSLLDDNSTSDKENRKTHQQGRPSSRQNQVYTSGDTFSGGGGSSLGAVQAGLLLKFATDNDAICCQTLAKHFRNTKIFEMDIHKFATKRDPQGELVVDVAHTSCPCQPYSPAHPCKGLGKNDEKNTAALFAVSSLILKTKPRIITSENTAGLLHTFSVNYFYSLIGMLTDAGYSVNWEILKFQDFGLPQSRARLIVVAAGPGETLPDLPAYTHNQHGTDGLKKWTSTQSVLNSIPRNAPQHDIASIMGKVGKNNKPMDGSTIATCLTTSGCQGTCHPNGKRGFTIRELAALQTFPHDYRFVGNNDGVIKRQIGNAVPPMFAKILFESIRKHLERSDAAEESGLRIFGRS